MDRYIIYVNCAFIFALFSRSVANNVLEVKFNKAASLCYWTPQNQSTGMCAYNSMSILPMSRSPHKTT